MSTPQPQNRRRMLESFLAQNPADAFARYGLALECAKEGDYDAASDYFRQLLASHANYVAGYFQYGQMLARIGRTEEARAILASGIETARRTGDTHAQQEMEAALAELC